ncbi:putative membrane protein YccC [Curtobacterium luteum]|uniref:Membrane protein YccC n=1 Tax=Curtobacterium luteum TaxID=33881 RepID=A0ABS2RSJ5_9MICO|nr:FUSC family protein [Curtobacterium luteum]MBM7801970.1 putative membrane protein YccC [Curtobacterium luteum]NUU51719.1 FUSC family protein [Curtobacterium luteum]
MTTPAHSTRTVNLEGAARAAIAGGAPLALLIDLGMPGYAAFAMFAGFTAIFGATEPYRQRAVTTGVAGALQAACMLAGIGVALLGHPLWLQAIGLVVVLVVAVCTLTALQTIPAQPIFPVFAFVVSALVPLRPADVPTVLLIIVCSVAWAWLVAMSGVVLRRVIHPHAPHRLRPLGERKHRTLAVLRTRALRETVALNVVGSLVAGGVAEALPGLGHPYWAVIAVVSTLPALRQRHTLRRAWQRVVGTVGGTVVAVGILLLEPGVWWIVVIAVVGQFFAEIFVARHYAVTLLFLTPLALAVSWLSLPEAPQLLALDRIVQTVLGAVVSVALLLVGRAVERRRGRPLGATSAVPTI